jgi:DNA polymerase III subunit beta
LFELSIKRDDLLNPLLMVAGAVEKRQTLPILSNILIDVSEQQMLLDATDTEIEIIAKIACPQVQGSGITTVSGKKLIDICRSFKENSELTLCLNKGNLSIKQGRSRFKLVTMEAEDFPNIEDEANELEFSIDKRSFVKLLQTTHFSMAQQDVRYYLNGLLLEMTDNQITSVATDGHRLALCQLTVDSDFPEHKVIIPRKAVQEMLRLLANVEDEKVLLSVSKHHFYLTSNTFTFISKLIEGRFPHYKKVIPKNNDKEVIIGRDALKSSLSRVSILANEKYRGVLLHVLPAMLTIIANNQEQEEAIESLEADTLGQEIKIGINASYLLDVLNNVVTDSVKLSLSEPGNSMLIEPLTDDCAQYIIMPMKI